MNTADTEFFGAVMAAGAIITGFCGSFFGLPTAERGRILPEPGARLRRSAVFLSLTSTSSPCEFGCVSGWAGVSSIRFARCASKIRDAERRGGQPS